MSNRKNSKLRWGIIGCANIAIKSVIPGIVQSETGVVAAVASRDLTKARETAQTLHINKFYGDYESLLQDAEIDAVYIPLPNHLHYEWTLRAAQAGKHVLCEKPIALNAAEARQMAKTCQDVGVVLAEAFMYRHHPRYDRIRDIIATGEIGDVRGIHSTFTLNSSKDLTNVRFRQAMGGGSIYDVGCYPINVARFLLAAEPKAATVTAFFSQQHDGVDMMASGLLEFPNDVALTFDCGLWAGFRNTLEVLGEHGRIEVPHAFIGDPSFFVHVNGAVREETAALLNAYSLQADAFARAVFREEPLRFTPDDAIRNMRVIDACLASARQHRRIALA